ncbi:MAG: hypothetical protein QGH40_12490 [bacterium]|nr:hypothetical protein [bacterium]
MNQCQKCQTEFKGRVCPDCGLVWHARCSGCGARIYWNEMVACSSCGHAVSEKDFFETNTKVNPTIT